MVESGTYVERCVPYYTSSFPFISLSSIFIVLFVQTTSIGRPAHRFIGAISILGAEVSYTREISHFLQPTGMFKMHIHKS